MSRQLPLLLAVTVAAALSVPVLAAGQGETVEIDGVVKIRNHAPAFHGRIVADNDACAEQRTVKMFERKRSGERRQLGTTSSDFDGKWQVLVDPLKSGSYFAVAPRREQGTAGTIYVCLRLKSRTLVVD